MQKLAWPTSNHVNSSGKPNARRNPRNNVFHERLIIFADGRQPRCFNCELKVHTRAKCQPAEQTETTQEKDEEENMIMEEEEHRENKKEDKEERWVKVANRDRINTLHPQIRTTRTKRRGIKKKEETTSITYSRLIDCVAVMQTAKPINNKSTMKAQWHIG